MIFKHCGPVGTHKALEDLEKEKKDGKDLPFDQNDYYSSYSKKCEEWFEQ